MIDQEVLQQLVPNRFPEDDFRREDLPDRSLKEPQHWISTWSAYLRWRLRAEADKGRLGELMDQSGFITTGIFRVTRPYESPVDPSFPVVEGVQFGALLLRGSSKPETYLSTIPLEHDRLHAPIREVVASFNLHGPAYSDGCISAVYDDEHGHACGITARHVVQRYRRGERVPLHCSNCGYAARMLRSAPGLIDAASVRLPCGCPHYRCPPPGALRAAIEGETVHLHLGQSGMIPCTVMASASTPSQIKSAAMPKHFLTEKHGFPGDSGSLIASSPYPDEHKELIGMYLGETACEDPENVFVTYGFALDLKQAADILGARDLQGNYHD